MMNPEMQKELIYQQSHVIVAVIAFMGAIFNALVIAIICKVGRRKMDKTLIYLLSLAMSDVAVDIVTFFAPVIRRTFCNPLEVDTVKLCENPFRIFTTVLDVVIFFNRFLTLYISHQRVLMVWSLQTALNCRSKTNNRIVFEIILIFLLSVVFTISFYYIKKEWSRANARICFLVLVIVVTLCAFMYSFIMFYKTRANLGYGSEIQNSNRANESFQKLILSLVIVFCFCQIPYIFNSAIRLCGDKRIYSVLFYQGKIVMVMYFFNTINSSINFFFYLAYMKTFRDTFWIWFFFQKPFVNQVTQLSLVSLHSNEIDRERQGESGKDSILN